jgi:hypothetical protein
MQRIERKNDENDIFAGKMFDFSKSTIMQQYIVMYVPDINGMLYDICNQMLEIDESIRFTGIFQRIVYSNF